MVAVPVLVIGGLSPLGDLLIAPLENRFPRADLSGGDITGIIVLGGSEDSRAGASRELAGLNEAAERLTEAVVLARRLPNARVVFSGGIGGMFVDEPPEVGDGRASVRSARRRQGSHHARIPPRATPMRTRTSPRS